MRGQITLFDISFESKQTELKNILKELEMNIREIEAAAVVSIEGLPIAASLPDDIEETMLAAMTASMLSLGERVSQELKRGNLEKIFVEGSNGFVISTAAGPNAVLAVSARKDAKLGLIFLDMQQAAQKIAQLLS